ncbi:MAG: hypothetical protein ACT4OQ_13190 [Chloroflexota bacterium]
MIQPQPSSAIRDGGRRRLVRLGLGIGALFSGAALLGNILIGLPLPITLGATAAVAFGGGTVLLWRAETARRAALLKTIGIGISAGFLATLIYDAAKFGLSQLDPSPYNPFEATRLFGQLLIGTAAPGPLIVMAGTAFHFLNGTMFGLAFTVLFARGGRTSVAQAGLTGAAWGLFLEAFQYTLYPDWLGIRLVDEFIRISALSHLAYGAGLGLIARWGYRQARRPQQRRLW